MTVLHGTLRLGVYTNVNPGRPSLPSSYHYHRGSASGYFGPHERHVYDVNLAVSEPSCSSRL